MNQNKLTFQSENLVVDWISFKFQHLDKFTETQIISYLFKLGFNSYQESGKLGKPFKEPIQVHYNNKFEVLFVKESPYWQGTTLNFSGSNALGFYAFIQKNLIDLTVFSSAVINRFDLYYFRTNQIKDKISGKDFLENCQRKIKQTNKQIKMSVSKKIAKVGF
jgi:hypothetical protein